MFITTRLAAAIALSATAFAPLAATAEPVSTRALRIQPAPPTHRHELPRFGMSSYNDGYGERIVRVRYGGVAWRLGLERGDRILRINRSRLNYHGSWWYALQRAMDRGGHVLLYVEDVRTGRIVTRHIDFDPHAGPVVTPKVQVVDYAPDYGHQPHIVHPPVIDEPIVGPQCGTPPYAGDHPGPITPKFRQPPVGERFGPTLKKSVEPTAKRRSHRTGRLTFRLGL